MKKVLVGLGGTLLLTLAGALAARAIVQRQTAARQRIPIPPGVDSIEAIRLGGVEQWIQIRGRSPSLPILLFLHGGPGFSEMPLAHVNAALADDFLVVEWDQRGTGKSYSSEIPAESMTVAQMVADTRELVLLLRARFHAPKIFLVAHSWGTILGAEIVAQSPELFHAYVAISQVVQPPEAERMMYRFAMEQAHAAGATKISSELERIGEPPYEKVASYNTMKKWIYHFGDAEYPRISPLEFARLILASPAYSDRSGAPLAWLSFLLCHALARGVRDSLPRANPEARCARLFFPRPPRSHPNGCLRHGREILPGLESAAREDPGLV